MQIKKPSTCYSTQDDQPDLAPGHKRTGPWLIPHDWELCPVGRMGDVLTGKALAANAPGERRPYLRTKNVFDGRIDIDDVLTMPMTDVQFEQFRIQHGDVLLNEGQSLELVGRCALYKEEYPQPCAIQNQLLRFRARKGVSAEFASHLFRYCQQTGIFARIALQTTSIAHLGGSRFERLSLPWPKGEAEQRAIAEALSDVDGLLGALEALIAKKRAVKQATMHQLLTGRKRLPEFSGEWETLSLGDVEKRGDIELYRGNVISQRDIDRTPGDYPIYSSSVQSNGLFGRYGHYMFDEELLTWSIDGGGHFFHRPKHRFSVTNVCGVIRIRTPNIHCRFLAYHLQDLHSRKTFDYTLKAHPSVIRGSYEVSLPTIEEQTAIGTVLSDMDSEISALEARHDKTLAIKQGMMQQLLTGRVRLVAPHAVAPEG